MAKGRQYTPNEMRSNGKNPNNPAQHANVRNHQAQIGGNQQGSTSTPPQSQPQQGQK